MVDKLIKENDQKFGAITSFFRGIKEENMKNIQKNKNTVKDLKDKERTLIKDLHKNKKMIESMKKPRLENAERKKRKAEYEGKLKTLKAEQNKMIQSIKMKKDIIKELE